MTHLQALALADNTAFRNSLVSMRPKSTTSDLPTSYDVKIHIHNEFVKQIKQLGLDIAVSLEICQFEKLLTTYPSRRPQEKSR